MKTILQEDLIMFKAIKRFVNKVRHWYYGEKGLMCELCIEEAKADMDMEDVEYWTNKYNKYVEKFNKTEDHE